jgi:hypothetical protein
LTSMATAAKLHQLAQLGELRKYSWSMARGQQVRRVLYTAPTFFEWLGGGLLAVPKVGVLNPAQELRNLFQQFVLGVDMAPLRQLARIRPTEAGRWETHGVWEMRSLALRVFGWAPCENHFIAVEGAAVGACKDHELYQGFRGSVIRFRDALPLDTPKFHTGGTVQDVFPT